MKGRLFKKFLSDTVTIYRKEAEGDKYGGEKSGWVRKYWEVKARIYGNSGGQYKIQVDGNDFGISHKSVMNRNVDVLSGDKMIDDGTDRSFIVLRVYELKQTKKVHHIELLLSEIQE